MKLKSIGVEYSRKLNLGDFNSAHVSIKLFADLDEDESEDQVVRALWEMAKANVKAQLAPLTTKIKAEVQELYLGLPVEVREQLEDNPFGDNDQ